MIHIATDKELEKLVERRIKQTPPTERPEFNLDEKENASPVPRFSRDIILPADKKFRKKENQGNMPDEINLYDAE